MIPSSCVNTIPLGSQVTAKGLVAGQMVTAAPPVTAVCLSAPPDQNAMNLPSGEKVGFDHELLLDVLSARNRPRLELRRRTQVHA